MEAGFTAQQTITKWERHRSSAYFDKLSLHVQADADGFVRVQAVAAGTACSFGITADQARLLAAELIAAADSTVREAA